MIAASKTVSLACVALWALLATAAAAQTPAPGFRQEQTREGCLYYSPDFATTDWTFTWLGSCVRGRLIDGKGTLEGSGPQGFTPRMSGQMVGGYFHGPITLVSIYPVPGRQDMIETQNSQYNMGCNVTWPNCKPAPTQARAAVPAAPAAPARAQREAEGRQLLNTPAVQKLLRNPNRTYQRSVERTLTPSVRALANEARKACQADYEGAFVGIYVDRMQYDNDPAMAVADMDFNLVLSPTKAAERAASGEADSIGWLRREAAREDAGYGAALRCVARHHLERLGIPIEDEASVLALSGTSPSTDSRAAGKPRAEEDPVDADEYADRCLRALIPGQNMGGGGFGAIENKCGFPINYTFCNLNPRPGSWSEAFDCSQGKLGSWHVGANGKSSAHTAGAERVYMFACRAPADTRKTTYQLGRGIIGECR